MQPPATEIKFGAMYHASHMEEALRVAALALECDECPVGALFVCAKTGRRLAAAHNLTHSLDDPCAHAEFVAARVLTEKHRRRQTKKLQRDRATDTTVKLFHNVVLYVTVEPCIMCAAMLRYEGIHSVYFGCHNPRFGGNGTILSIHSDISVRSCSQEGVEPQEAQSHPPYLSRGGYLATEAIELLKRFYNQENPAAPVTKRAQKEQKFL